MSEAKYLTKDGILNSDDRPVQELEVPEWGGTIRIMAMMAQERDRLEAASIEEGGDKFLNFRSKVVVASVVDEAGELLFTHDDIEALSKKSAAAISAVAQACMDLSGFGSKDVEDITKN
jgi:hypothetical protein